MYTGTVDGLKILLLSGSISGGSSEKYLIEYVIACFSQKIKPVENWPSGLKECSYEKNQPGKTGCLGLPRSRLYYQFLIKIFELSYEKRAGPAYQDLALFRPKREIPASLKGP